MRGKEKKENNLKDMSKKVFEKIILPQIDQKYYTVTEFISLYSKKSKLF